MSDWHIAEWHTEMPVIFLRDGHRVVARVPVDTLPEAVPDGPAALIWAILRLLESV